MALPWKIVDRFCTEDNSVLELRRRGKGDFIIFHDTRVLMNSKAQRSEIALGRLACGHLQNHPAPRILVGGLGMGFTLRAALDILPASARVVVAELNPRIVDWCKGPLAGLTGDAVSDPRVTMAIGDVSDLIGKHTRDREKPSFNAIILDLYHGPHPDTDKRDDPLYGSRAIERTRTALEAGGTFAVWGENDDEGFVKRLSSGGFTVTCKRPGKGGYRHTVFLATKK